MTVASTASMVESPARFFYTAEEVAAHRTADDCWIIYKDAVHKRNSSYALSL